MNKFIEDRAKLVRAMADKADSFTKVRLLRLAEKYENQLRPSLATREINRAIDYVVQTSPSER